MRGAGIHPMLDLSTAHMPGQNADFGDVRWEEHQYGWIVFVSPETEISQAASWLRPILRYAKKHKCYLINFDVDAEELSAFKRYSW